MFDRLLPSLALMVLAAQGAFAIAPSEPWHAHRNFSANKKFYAQSTPDGTTEVKQVQRWWFGRTLWTTPHYFEWAMVADDGSFVVSSWGLVPPPFGQNQTVIEVFLRDGSIRKLPLGWFVKNRRNLHSTESESKAWGGPVSLDGDWIRVEGVEGRISLVNAKTGKLRVLSEGTPKQSRP